MADGMAHNIGTAAVTLVSGGIAYSVSGNAEFAGWVSAGSVLTLFVNPDSDQEAMNRNERKLVRNTLGLGFVWLALWHPYAMLFRHRGISHVPVIGTLTRVAYIGLVVLALAYAVYLIEPYRIVVDQEWATLSSCGIIIGMAASDLLHWVMDGMAL